MPSTTPGSVIVASKDQVSTEVKGNAVLLQLKNGKYYNLNGVGSVIWEQLKTPTTIDALVDAVTERFDVERAQCQSDVERLVSELSDAGFVEVKAE